MSKPKLLQFDNCDDRSEVKRLLAVLHPRDRWTFLEWCAAQCKTISGKRPGILLDARDRRRMDEAIRAGGRADEDFALEVYFHIWHLHVAWQLDLDATLAKLVEMARGRTTARDVKRELRRAHHSDPGRLPALHPG